MGNNGKSFLAKYIALKFGCIIADGKKDNIFNQVLMMEDKRGIILLDVPRHNVDYINYGCLEALKNGLIYSGKYEGGQCIFDIPHIIVFMNDIPNGFYEKFSGDRYEMIWI